jgi:hypothetical protein
VLNRAVESLRELPPDNPAAVSRIVTAAARLREIDAEPHNDDLLLAPRGRTMHWPAVAAIAAAAAFVGYLVGGGRGSEPPGVAASEGTSPVVAPASPAAVSPSAVVPAVQVAGVAPEAIAIPTQFVFDSRSAKRVMLVGDFNGWDERAVALEREDGSSLWSATVPLLPGRHVYAFLVDSVWTTDPRAPKTRDPDFGVTGSVVIVGKP